MTAATKPTLIANDQKTFNISPDQIVADPKKNYRTTVDPKEFHDTKESIKKLGQLQAVEVTPRPDGKYDLNLGFRRYAIISELIAEGAKHPNGGLWETIRVTVETDTEGKPLDPKARKLRNMAENMARENLTTYDQAMAFHDLKKNEDLTAQAIAANTGKSVSYVNNLVRLAEMLDKPILKRWQEESQPDFGLDKEGKRVPNMRQVCTVNWLQDVAANVPKAEQEHALHKALGLVEDEEEEDEDEDEEGGSERNPKQPTGTKRPSMGHLKKALENAQKDLKGYKDDCKASKLDPDEGMLARFNDIIGVLNFAVGERKSVKSPVSGNIFTMPAES